MILKTLLRSLKDGTHCFQEIAASPVALRDYLAEAAKTSLAESRFLDVLPGFVLEGERVPLIQERLALLHTDHEETGKEGRTQARRQGRLCA